MFFFTPYVVIIKGWIAFPVPVTFLNISIQFQIGFPVNCVFFFRFPFQFFTEVQKLVGHTRLSVSDKAECGKK